MKTLLVVTRRRDQVGSVDYPRKSVNGGWLRVLNQFGDWRLISKTQ